MRGCGSSRRWRKCFRFLRAPTDSPFQGAAMISRLAATLLLLAALSACSGPKPAAKAPEVKAQPRANASDPGYQPAESPTLEAVRARGYVACGVHAALPGFALKYARGDWRGFDVDICRAVAAAALGDANKVRFTVIGAQYRLG